MTNPVGGVPQLLLIKIPLPDDVLLGWVGVDGHIEDLTRTWRTRQYNGRSIRSQRFDEIVCDQLSLQALYQKFDLNPA